MVWWDHLQRVFSWWDNLHVTYTHSEITTYLIIKVIFLSEVFYSHFCTFSHYISYTKILLLHILQQAPAHTLFQENLGNSETQQFAFAAVFLFTTFATISFLFTTILNFASQLLSTVTTGSNIAKIKSAIFCNIAH